MMIFATPKFILGLTLFGFVLSYVVMTFKDTKEEWCLVFDRRLLRKDCWRFSIRSVLVWVTAFAVAFAAFHRWPIMAHALPLALVTALVAIPGLMLFWIGIHDAFSRNTKRKYRDRL